MAAAGITASRASKATFGLLQQTRKASFGLALSVLGACFLWSVSDLEVSQTLLGLPGWTGRGRPTPVSLRGRRVVMLDGAEEEDETAKLKAAAKRLADKTPRLAPMAMPFGQVSLDLSMMSYNQFVPRLYNMCRGLGFKKGKILPSIGFCSDENQGYPTILITKHFGAYPFNHGYIGGIMALDRHGPHASHADDVVLVHAPHVGFEPDLGEYGTYRRRQIEAGEGEGALQMSGTCGKVVGVLTPYVKAYEALLARIRVRVEGEQVLIALSRVLLPSEEPEGGGVRIHLRFDQLLEEGALDNPVLPQSTSSTYRASPAFAEKFKEFLAAHASEDLTASEPDADASKISSGWLSLKNPKLSGLLTADMFAFKKPQEELRGEEHRLERALLPNLPKVLTSPYDNELSASLICMQSEFDRSVHSVAAEPSYKGKNLILISGLNIDVSPEQDLTEAFPTTMFLPWAAYVQLQDGSRRVVEQSELVSELFSQSTENPDAIDMEESIRQLFVRKRSRITFFDTNTNKKKAAQVL
eukprot:TRINITY_DN1195_c0_g2_i1.p1 TRINITY_DN1195_c0_g2~~TRINITY_DN1195_c0_g2_i1.p1  ORF type:complete len:539 (-),score=107.82 TRINITY_DN1195_c0_g2_i1:79-1659(-)